MILLKIVSVGMVFPVYSGMGWWWIQVYRSARTPAKALVENAPDFSANSPLPFSVLNVMVCNGRITLLRDDHFAFRGHHSRRDRRVRMNEQEEGYSGLFYVMLILGIIGVLGFLMVAAGAGAAGGL